MMKFYPKRANRPSIRSILVGAAIDFGWLVIAGAIIFAIRLQSIQDPFFYSANLRFGIIVVGLLAVQMLVVEIVIAWGLYFYHQRSKGSSRGR